MLSSVCAIRMAVGAKTRYGVPVTIQSATAYCAPEVVIVSMQSRHARKAGASSVMLHEFHYVGSNNGSCSDRCGIASRHEALGRFAGVRGRFAGVIVRAQWIVAPSKPMRSSASAVKAAECRC
jgi:hypothetical protein